MAYNPYSAVDAIYKLKGQWDDANKAGDTTARDSAAAKAQEYYKQLRSNGYGEVADELTTSDYLRAKPIRDKWAKMGKTSAKDYLYTLGQSKGVSQSDVDKLIGYDDLTGEISFGGKKIGVPDSVVDGNYYLSDTSVLDSAFDDYISRSGTVRSNQTAVNQENEKLFAKYNQEFEDLKNTNPFETETGKAILAKYDLAGLQGRDNEVASGAGSNGGNIDSFAAANALRQQSALISQGQTAALEAHQQKLDHARALLSDMGVNIDRVFNQGETAKNNDVARKADIAAVTGETPDEWTAANNPYMNDDGTIKEEYKDVDFSSVMAKAKAAGNTEAYNAAAVARYYKIMGNYGAYGQYDDGNYVVPGAKKTEAARQFDEQIAASDRALAAEQSEAAAERQNKLALADKDAAAKLEQIKLQAEYDAADPNAESDGTYRNGVKVGDKNGKPILTKDQASEMRDAGNTSEQVMYALEYYGEDVPDIADVVSDAEWDEFLGYFSDPKLVKFLTEQLKPYYDYGREINEEILKNLIIGAGDKNSNSAIYDIDVEDARAISNALGLNSAWVDDYKNKWGFNSGKGMKPTK